MEYGNRKSIRILRSHPGDPAFDTRDSRKRKQRKWTEETQS